MTYFYIHIAESSTPGIWNDFAHFGLISQTQIPTKANRVRRSSKLEDDLLQNTAKPLLTDAAQWLLFFHPFLLDTNHCDKVGVWESLLDC